MKLITKPRTNPSEHLAARRIAMATCAALLSAAPFQAAHAQVRPALGAAGSFAVLSGATVTCTDSTIGGNTASLATGGAVVRTGCTINGSLRAGKASMAAASADLLAAHAALAAMPDGQCDHFVEGTLAGVSLPPGVYCFDGAATLTGRLTLDGPGDGLWIFRVGASGVGALTGTSLSVVMAGGGLPSNVSWWVADAVTMTGSSVQGTILSGAATTFTGSSLSGRILAKAGVTLTRAAVSPSGEAVSLAGP
jgi:hypothetical protein